MNMCKYCKDAGMTLEEYTQFEKNINEKAKAIRSQLSYNGGMYYDTKDLFESDINEDIKYFIIQELKEIGIEFFKNNELYRVTE